MSDATKMDQGNLPGPDEVMSPRAYDGWTVYGTESMKRAAQAAEEAKEQLGWKDGELDDMEVAASGVRECLWRREKMRFLRREIEGLREALRREVSLDDIRHLDGYGSPRCSWCMVIDPDLNEHEEGCPVRVIGWRTLTEILEDPDA